MKRQIHIFDKATEALKCTLDVTIPIDKLLYHYKRFLNEDPELIYEYEINIEDESFYKEYLLINFDFEHNDYFLSCSVS